jgi:hypothetical protein
MKIKKKIAVISTHSFGYIDFLVQRLNAMENVDLTYVNIDLIPFSYKSKISRITNSLLKLMRLRGLKEKNRTNFIKKIILENNSFDQTLIIRPDKLEKEALLFLRKNSVEMSCFLFDGIENYHKQKKTLPFFDTVFSYDKVDVEKYNFQFLTNYIYDDEIENNTITQLAFNITSFDNRFPILEKLAYYFSKNEIPYRFIVKKDRIFVHEYIEISNTYIKLSEVKNIISSSFALVDIQQQHQIGLSFRVFEALGFKKKLITNNQDIINYDFYNPNNIFIISDSNYEVPSIFFETDYIEVSSEIINRYGLNNWLSIVLKVD